MANPSTTMREAGTSISTQRSARWRPSLSHLLIGLAVVLAFVFNLLAIQDRSATTLVAVANRPLQLGTALTSDDLRFVPVASDFDGLGSLLTETQAQVVEGWIVDRAIPEGGLVVSESLAQPGASNGLRSMSVAVSVEHAAGGTIRSGDRIDVIAVVDGVASFVAADVEVLGTADTSDGALGAIGDYFVVVAVNADQALAIAAAVDSASVEIVKSTGASAVDESDDGT